MTSHLGCCRLAILVRSYRLSVPVELLVRNLVGLLLGAERRLDQRGVGLDQLLGRARQPMGLVLRDMWNQLKGFELLGKIGHLQSVPRILIQSRVVVMGNPWCQLDQSGSRFQLAMGSYSRYLAQLGLVGKKVPNRSESLLLMGILESQSSLLGSHLVVGRRLS